MSTAFGFSAITDAVGVTVSGRSVGAHLAAKLESFSSDERTLTDELCDMLCIWLAKSPPSGPTLALNLKKTTVKQEKNNGADLRLVISAPCGIKDCLLQAKVLDPLTGKLRFASKSGYSTLKKQLQKARASCGSLAFLLVYVPSQHLDGANHGFGSWEQGYCSMAGSKHSSAYGATVIPVDYLLDPSGNWWDPKHRVPHAGGVFANGIPFSQFLLELLVCFRGNWAEREDEYLALPRQSTLTLEISLKTDDSLERIQESARSAIARDF